MEDLGLAWSAPEEPTHSLLDEWYLKGHCGTMAVLQVFQAKLLHFMDESGQDSDAFKELRTATDLALHATKATAQAIGKAMANLVVLEHHFWLNLTEIRDGGLPQLASLVYGTIWPCCRWVCRAFYSGTEDLADSVSLLAKVIQCGGWFKSPKDPIHPAACKTDSALAKT